MKEQNYASHARYRTSFHFVATPLLLAALVMAGINVANANKENCLQSILLLLIVIILALTHFHSRIMPLKAQDRVIRVEENFRHFILTGQPLDANLRLRQIIALRFASDEEFPDLAKKALAEKLEPKQIKQAIKKWRADRHRV